MTWRGLFRVEGWVKCLEAEVPWCSCWPGCGEALEWGMWRCSGFGSEEGEWAWSWRSGPACRSSPKVAQCPRLLCPQPHRGPHPAGPLPGVWATRPVLSAPGLAIASSVKAIVVISALFRAPVPSACSVLTPGEVGWERTCVLTLVPQHSILGSALAEMDAALEHELFFCGSVEGVQGRSPWSWEEGTTPTLSCSLFLIILLSSCTCSWGWNFNRSKSNSGVYIFIFSNFHFISYTFWILNCPLGVHMPHLFSHPWWETSCDVS